jgi:hypothetical protein
MTPQRKMLTSGKRLSLTLTECRRNFFRRMAEKIFFGDMALKKAQKFRFSDLCALLGLVSALIGAAVLQFFSGRS